MKCQKQAPSSFGINKKNSVCMFALTTKWLETFVRFEHISFYNLLFAYRT